MKFIKNNDTWILKGMAHKQNTPFHSGLSIEIWQQEDLGFITVAMIAVWKFYAGIFLSKMPKKVNW